MFRITADDSMLGLKVEGELSGIGFMAGPLVGRNGAGPFWKRDREKKK